MLEVREVTKRYGALTAVRNVSFTVRPGEVLGYLGPNGSGKSTTVKMLAGLMPPTFGTISFEGRDIQDDLIGYKAQVGYVPEEATVYTYLTAPEHLRLCGRLRGIASGPLEAKIDRFLRILALDTDRHAALSSFSKGMRQKVLLAAALIHNPRVVILDEPVSGLDVSTALVLRTIVKALAADGRIIFYSSHELDTVEKISTRVMILRAGEVVADDSASNLRELMHLPSLEDVFSQLAVKDDVEAVAADLLGRRPALTMSTAVDARDQVRALTRAFLSRFFESEITASTDDLKGSFFWLLAALAMPGVFIPWLMVFDWHMIGIFQGADKLREASGAEKTFYLGFSMIASGLLTAIAWTSLLPDRRDTLILGALPVRPRTIVLAKLAALAGFIAIVAVSMHTIGSVFFGAILSTNSPFLFLVRGMAAHFVATCAATAAVALWVAAAQGVTLAIVGPRLFVRLTTVLQAALVVLIVLGLASLPTITSSVVHTVRGFGRNVQPWLLATPPVWFLGLYEWVLGTSDPVIIGLARTAGLALVVPSVAIAIAYPLAYKRLMVAVVEIGNRPGRSALARASSWALVTVAGRHPAARATADFLTSSLARVERHRFVLAIALGVAIAWGLPGWKSFTATAPLQPALLALPLVAMMFLLVGLRIASALPADVRAAWLFEVHSPSRAHARQGLERMMFVLGVLPPVVLSAPLYWWVWGSSVAVMHSVISIGLGVLLIELLIWHCEGMPCGQRWSPARLDLGRRWPLHLLLFLIVTAGIPELELLLFRSSYWTAGFVVTLIAAAAATRYASARHQIVPSYDDVDPVAGVLRLN